MGKIKKSQPIKGEKKDTDKDILKKPMSTDRDAIKERLKKLLSCKRLNELKSGSNIIECADHSEPRNPFQRDCDRITYSYPFRRMQNKTQVIPRPEIDFIHTRLTHSLEVATVGRSLGRLLEKHLGEDEVDLLPDEYTFGSIPAIVAAACLAHDIGNPPFGHSGEDSISNYFRFGNGLDKIFSHLMLEEHFRALGCGALALPNVPLEAQVKWMDLMRFEGNAMGFRLLAKHNGEGFNLTCATLATFSKYPRQSYIPKDGLFDDTRWTEGASQKKYGFFYDETEDFKLVANEVGLLPVDGLPKDCLAWHRHPLAFLMEAADDICYRIIDLEDGFRIGKIPFKSFEKTLHGIAKLDKRFNQDKYKEYLKADEKQAFSYLRSKSINYLIHAVIEVFKRNLVAIFSGKYDRELIKDIECFKLLNSIKVKYVKPKVYLSSEVLEIEAAGFEIIEKLLHEFTEASDLCSNSCPEVTQNLQSKKFMQILPDEFDKRDGDTFTRYQAIACYVAGMSDTYALDMFRKITGISMR